MEAQIFIGLVLRLLPAIVVVILAFVAVRDKKTRDQWNNLLYQIGSIRPDQLEDVKVGSGVKWPFFIVAIALLLWPIQFYRHSTRSIDASASDLKIAKPQSDLSRPAPAGNSVSDAPVGPQSDLHARPTPAANVSTPQSDLSQVGH